MNDENSANRSATNDKGDGITRVSRLKKRRRTKAEASPGLQTRRPPLPVLSGGGTKSAVNDRTNSNVGRASGVDFPSPIMLGGIANDYSASSRPLPSVAMKSNTRHQSSALSPLGNNVDRNISSEFPVDANHTSKDASPSILGFMDTMDQSALMSTIPNILCVDRNKYDATSCEFKRALEQAFEYNTHQSTSSNVNTTDAIYHPLVGRIEVTSFSSVTNANENNRLSLSFPPSTSHITETNNEKEAKFDNYFMNYNLKRKTGDGMCIPMSLYQFPSTQSPTEGGDLDTNHQHYDGITEQPKHTVEENNSHQTTSTTSYPSMYQGRIRIESGIGATVREVFDIDESQHTLGKLSCGDERYFIEKKILAAPPISLDDSDSDHDEIVAVVRYKILLEQGDLDSPDATCPFAEKDGDGRILGWISDRGRFTDDSHLILREL